MSRSKKPRRHYDPGRLFHCVAARQERKAAARPLDLSQTNDIGLAYHLSFNAVQGGYATEEAWSQLACSMNIAMLLAEQGVGSERLGDIRCAQDALMRAKARGERTGKWGLDGDGIRDLRAAITAHDAQMATASKAQVQHAISEMHRRMKAGDVLGAA
ncbi:hypothetical protein [Pandoraea norimbergensis]